jgi:Fe2+ or Zn2+ uptake regulation protein
MTGPAHHFICQLCARRFHSHVPIEEVVAEAEANFGPLPEDNSLVVSVCDDCYQQVMAWAKTEGLPKRWEE